MRPFPPKGALFDDGRSTSTFLHRRHYLPLGKSITRWQAFVVVDCVFEIVDDSCIGVERPVVAGCRPTRSAGADPFGTVAPSERVTHEGVSTMNIRACWASRRSTLIGAYLSEL